MGRTDSRRVDVRNVQTIATLNCSDVALPLHELLMHALHLQHELIVVQKIDVLRTGLLTLEDLDLHSWLIACVSREGLTLSRRDR